MHFDDQDVNDDLESDNSITYKAVDAAKNVVSIHLGFLQVNHKYKLGLQLPVDMCASIKRLAERGEAIKLAQQTDDSAVAAAAVNTNNCKLIEYHKDEKSNGLLVLDLCVEFLAYKEKFLREELQLLLNDTDAVTFIITARVLGKGKGTPLLRNGIQTLSIDVDDNEAAASSDEGNNN